MLKRIENPRNVGSFSEEKGFPCMTGRGERGDVILELYWLVDPADGVIVDAKFQIVGPPALIAAADAACDLFVHKHYLQAKRIHVDLIQKQLGYPEPALRGEQLEVLFLAIESAVATCEEMSLPKGVNTPVPQAVEEGVLPDWQGLSHKERVALIEAVIAEDIRPYIELDEGGIEILDLIGERELIIAYKGACTSCFSSVGSTLSTIQSILQAKVYPELVVVPNF